VIYGILEVIYKKGRAKRKREKKGRFSMVLYPCDQISTPYVMVEAKKLGDCQRRITELRNTVDVNLRLY
jgi:hypothetical protein